MKIKNIIKLVLILVIVTSTCNGQYVTLQGRQFKDQNGADFYPMICNYITEIAKDASGNLFILPHTKYGANSTDDCSNIIDCQ